jgi:hypothetical protein
MTAAKRKPAGPRQLKIRVLRPVRPTVVTDKKDKVQPAEWSEEVREFLEECDYSQR